MLSLAINRHSMVPIYYQIQQRLLEQIQSGALKAGDPVPSEQGISAQLGVSRMTARQALKPLCDLGLTYSLRGKGTFVSAMKLEKNFRQVQSFSEEMLALGLKPRSRVLAFDTIGAPAEAAGPLRLTPGEPVVRLRRVRLADSSPMGIECSYLPLKLCPGLMKTFNPHASLYQALSTQHGIQLFFADEVVEAGFANADEAKLLGIRRRSPVFLFTRTSYVQDGRPVEFVKSTYRADRYKIVNRLTRLNRELLLPQTKLTSI
jgi:GntR family transcriptional regulator